MILYIHRKKREVSLFQVVDITTLRKLIKSFFNIYATEVYEWTFCFLLNVNLYQLYYAIEELKDMLAWKFHKIINIWILFIFWTICLIHNWNMCLNLVQVCKWASSYFRICRFTFSWHLDLKKLLAPPKFYLINLKVEHTRCTDELWSLEYVQ